MNKSWRKSSKDKVQDDQGQRSRKERESGRCVAAVVVNMWVSKFAQLKVKFALSVQNLITIHECMCRSKTVHEDEALNNSSYEDGDFFIGVVNDVSDI